jgi:hypothetical protein
VSASEKLDAASGVLSEARRDPPDPAAAPEATVTMKNPELLAV